MKKETEKVKKKRKKRKKKSDKIKLTKEQFDLIQKNKKKKEAALPILGKKYDRFKDKLVEISKNKAKRNLMIFQIGVMTGYRTGDILDLTVGEIADAIKVGKFSILENKTLRSWETYCKNKNKVENKDNEYYKQPRKEPKERVRNIGPNLKELLEEYIKGRNRSEYAFNATEKNKSKPMKVKTYSEKVTEAGNLLGLKNISAHSARKTFAHRVYDNNPMNLEITRKALGHKSIETTQVYLGLHEAEQEEITERTDNP